MKVDYADTVNIHVNLPRELVEGDRHTTRTIQIIRAVEAYIADWDDVVEPVKEPNPTWSFRV